MEIIQTAEKIAAAYVREQLEMAIQRRDGCGCGSCKARAKDWIEWTGGDEGSVPAYSGRLSTGRHQHRPAPPL
jgi:hypothetical protein